MTLPGTFLLNDSISQVIRRVRFGENSGRPVLHSFEMGTEVAILWGEVKGDCYTFPVFSTDLITLIHAKDWIKEPALCLSRVLTSMAKIKFKHKSIL